MNEELSKHGYDEMAQALRRALIAAFYWRYGFIPFADEPNRLFLPMGTIEALLA